MRLLLRHIKPILLFCFAMYFVQMGKVSAQTAYPLPPNQPEQDACNALQLCGSSFYTPYSYTGTGSKLDLDSTPCAPFAVHSGEVNSVWLRVHTSSAGNLVFTITPVDPQDDYDFAVIDISGRNCDKISLKDVIRCNYNSNLPGSNKNGVTGLSDTARNPYVLTGTFGNSFGQPMFARGDGDYLILVNNYGNYISGGASKGFTIDFSGSSARFDNPALPELKNVDEVCGDNSSLLVTTTSEISCSSIAADGSNFITNAPGTIISASGVNCTTGGYTRFVMLHFSSSLPAGKYTMNIKKSSGNKSITNLCSDELLSSSAAVPFIIKPGSKVSIENESICYQQLPYAWNGMQLTKGDDSIATYTTKSSAGCDSIVILNLQVSPPSEERSSSIRICDGDTYTLPWNADATEAGTYTHHYLNTNGCDSVVESVVVTVFTPIGGNVDTRDSTIQTGFCKGGSVLLDGGKNFASYSWNTGQATSSIIVDIAGSYSLEAKDNYGCTTIDTFVVALYPRPTADFLSSEHLCADSIVVLDGGKGYVSYLWDNGSTNQTITTDKPGIFWVRLTDTRDCTGTDTVHVTTVQRPAGFLPPGSITKCALKNTMLSPVNNFSGYAWSNGTHTKTATVSSGGLYMLTVTDDNGCTGRDSIRVIDSICPVYFYMPTAFTPNHDGHNDLFRSIFSGAIAGYHFSIYSRWGQLIFSTRDALKGWDGTINGNPQSIGSYMWLCSYSLDGQSIRTDRGTVTLIR